MPPIDELTRIEPVHLARLDRQGIFTTGLLLERSETTTRRQTLADQVAATTNDVLMWRDEALMLNLASFGPLQHRMLIQAGIEGLRDILDLSLEDFTERVRDVARRSWVRSRRATSRSRAGGIRRGRSRTSEPARPGYDCAVNDLGGRAASLITGIAVAVLIVAISIVPFLSNSVDRVRAGPRAGRGLDRVHTR